MISLFSPYRKVADVAVDFGTASLRIGAPNEVRPSQTPSVAGTRSALRHGVITDPAAATEVLKGSFAPYHRVKRVLACAPSDATEQEQQTLAHTIEAAGATESSLVPEPVAALVGAGVDINRPSIVVDLGEGVFDCALVLEKRMVASITSRGGCDTFRTSIIQRVEKDYGVRIHSAEAEMLLRRVGVTVSATCPRMLTLRDGCNVPASVITGVLQEEAEAVATMILDFWKTLPKKISVETICHGIQITGGGALIPGMVEYCAGKTGLPFVPAPHPLESVIHGACSILSLTSQFDLWESLQQFWPRANICH